MEGRFPSWQEAHGLEAVIDRGGLGVIVLESSDGGWPALPLIADGIMRLGLHRRGVVPVSDLDWFDILLSIDPLAPQPWVGLPQDAADAAVVRVRELARAQPLAAAV